MARLNIEELVGGLLEAAMVAQGISERQHINALRNYFNEDGTPKTTLFKIGEKVNIYKNFGKVGAEENCYIIEICSSGLFFKVNNSDKLFSIKTLHSKGSNHTSGYYLIPENKF